LSEHIFIHLEVGPLSCNCYVVGDRETSEAVIVDPGGDACEIASAIAGQGLTVTAIVATHAHFDHILAADELRSITGAPFMMHAADRPILDWLQESGRLFLGVDLGDPPDVDADLTEGGRIVAGSASLDVLHTPGHSPGSVSLLGTSNLFAGDTLFAGSVGRFDLPGGDGRTLQDSITSQLFELDDELLVWPGHGPSTTIGSERETNPFVGKGAGGLWTP
jgi:hydroxyacylglutathione hydrolase